jgi:GMP synthase-like glutamine amidotransferase
MAAKVEIIPKEGYRFYLPQFDREVQEMLIRRGHTIALKESQDWDIALFTGGADICPLLYGEKMLEGTNCNIPRDLREVSFFKSLHPKRMKVGICRGAQLLNVLSGGRLWQDVNNHANGGHEMDLFSTNKLITVSSRHHQMMIPTAEAWVMASSAEATMRMNSTLGRVIYTSEQLEKAGNPDPEVVYYGNTHSICFQPHPEDTDVPECTEFFFECIETLWSDKMHEESQKEW